jgi:tRNA threonylcarbamoyladenosine modification (KEOPS) complex  Pcc1 subunit
LAITVSNVGLARALADSLKPETKARSGFRSRTKIRSKGPILKVDIDAMDLVALRAATNSYLHFISAALSTVQTLSGFNKTQIEKESNQEFVRDHD